MKLNLGAGYELLEPTWEWVRIDLDPDTHPDILGDVRTLSKEWDGYFDEIRAVDILEHLSYRDTVPALQCWARALKPGGRMFIQVPAADVIMEEYVAPTELKRAVPADIERMPHMIWIAWRLLGGHYDDQYTRTSDRWFLNAHHALFDKETIHWAAEQAGLTVESIKVNPHPNYQVWLVKP